MLTYPALGRGGPTKGEGAGETAQQLRILLTLAGPRGSGSGLSPFSDFLGLLYSSTRKLTKANTRTHK